MTTRIPAKNQSRVENNISNNASPAQRVQFNDNREGSNRVSQFKSMANQQVNEQPIQKKNNTGLPDQLKSGIENLSGIDMSEVKVHYNSSQPAKLQAHAYAQGSNIHIAPGQEKHLPHEAWHIVQQKQGRVKPTKQLKGKININDDVGLEKEADTMGGKALQMKTKSNTPKKLLSSSGTVQFAKPKPLKKPSPYKSSRGEITLNAKNEIQSLELADLTIPTFKKNLTPSTITLPKRTKRPNNQVQIWESNAKKSSTGFDTEFQNMVKAAGYTYKSSDAYHLKIKNMSAYVVGKPKEIKGRALRPYWNPSGNSERYDVDHKQELQLGGTNTIGNMWLLQSTANQASGRDIKLAKDKAIQALLDSGEKHFGITLPSASKVRDDHAIKVLKILGGPLSKGDPTVYYTLQQIRDGEQLKGLEVLKSGDVSKKSASGEKDKLVIYTNGSGGGMKHIPWPSPNTGVQTKAITNIKYGKYLQITSITYDPTKRIGTMEGDAYGSHGVVSNANLKFNISKMNGVDFGGYISKNSVDRTSKKELKKAKKLSEIVMYEVELQDDGLHGEGVVITDIPLIGGTKIDIRLEGDKVTLFKKLNGGNFHLPKPFVFKESSLIISASEEGPVVEGKLEFEVENLGEGYFKGDTDGARLSFEGVFDLYPEMFDKASVKVGYKNGELVGEGIVKIGAGKVPGLKSATATASYSESSGWHILGTAQPNVPGINTNLRLEYHNGAFTIEGRGKYRNGMLNGIISIGFTNHVVDTNGNPTSAINDHFTPFGSGELTIKLGHNLEAQAGAKLLPNGEVEMSGKIGITDSIVLFNKKSLDIQLFKVTLPQVLLAGVDAGIAGIGLYGSVGAKANLYAGIGPGKVDTLNASVLYNPSQEDQTEIEGNVKLSVPGNAGIKANIPVSLEGKAEAGGYKLAGVKGELNLEGHLGVDAGVSIPAKIKWTPITGLELNAEPEAHFKSKIEFNVNAILTVNALTYSKSWKYNLLKKEFGPDLNYEIKFPINYKEREPFNLKPSDDKFRNPEKVVSTMIDDSGKQAFTTSNAKESGSGEEEDPKLVIYINHPGAEFRNVDWPQETKEKAENNLTPPLSKLYHVEQVGYNKGSGGTLTGSAFKNVKEIETISSMVIKMADADNDELQSIIEPKNVLDGFKDHIKFKNLGSVDLETAKFDENGLEAAGKLISDIKLVKDADFDFMIRNDQPSFRKEIKLGDYNLPLSVKVTKSTLVIYTEDGAIKIAGAADVAIPGLMKGKLAGTLNSGEGLKLTGNFEFEESHIFKDGKAKMIYNDGILRADGSAQLNIPGLEKGNLMIHLSQDSFKIGGSFNLDTSKMPGVAEGKVNAQIVRKGGKFEIYASGSATPSVEGFKTELSLRYANGALTLIGVGTYKHDGLEGNVKLGVTNQGVDDKGKLTGAKGKKLRAFGGGEVKFSATPWLDIEAGAQFLPNGEPELSGAVKLSQAHTFFDKIKMEQEPIEVPVISIPLSPLSVYVFGREIGLGFTIKAGTEASITIGPGRLEEISASILYNPYQKNKNKLAGKARITLPADAELKVFGTASVGTNAVVASIYGKLQASGGLALRAPMVSEVTLGWFGDKGFSMEAFAEAIAKSNLKLDLKAILEISVLLAGTSKWDKTLLEKEFGTGLQFGVKFPVTYVPGKGLDLSLNNIEFIKPDIKFPEIFTSAAEDTYKGKGKEEADENER